MLREFKVELFNGMSEYLINLKQGLYTTIEFSSSIDMYDEKVELIGHFNKQLNSDFIKWVMYECDVCRGYDSERPLHVEIIHKIHDKEYIELNNIEVE